MDMPGRLAGQKSAEWGRPASTRGLSAAVARAPTFSPHLQRAARALCLT